MPSGRSPTLHQYIASSQRKDYICWCWFIPSPGAHLSHCWRNNRAEHVGVLWPQVLGLWVARRTRLGHIAPVLVDESWRRQLLLVDPDRLGQHGHDLQHRRPPRRGCLYAEEGHLDVPDDFFRVFSEGWVDQLLEFFGFVQLPCLLWMFGIRLGWRVVMCLWLFSQLNNLQLQQPSARNCCCEVGLQISASLWMKKHSENADDVKIDWPSPEESCRLLVCSWNYLCRLLSPAQGPQSCIYLLSSLTGHAMRIQVQGSLCKQHNNLVILRKHDNKSSQAPRLPIGRYSRCSSYPGADMGDIIRK